VGSTAKDDRMRGPSFTARSSLAASSLHTRPQSPRAWWARHAPRDSGDQASGAPGVLTTWPSKKRGQPASATMIFTEFPFLLGCECSSCCTPDFRRERGCASGQRLCRDQERNAICASSRAIASAVLGGSCLPRAEGKSPLSRGHVGGPHGVA
jgi:hypothetical protein